MPAKNRVNTRVLKELQLEEDSIGVQWTCTFYILPRCHIATWRTQTLEDLKSHFDILPFCDPDTLLKEICSAPDSFFDLGQSLLSVRFCSELPFKHVLYMSINHLRALPLNHWHTYTRAYPARKLHWCLGKIMWKAKVKDQLLACAIAFRWMWN